ncbi:MAG: hypothetical protein AAGI30_02580 [Planctomycetota bacterium]
MHSSPGEQYTIRRQILRLLGAGFHIYGEKGQLIGFCKQKALRFREDFRLFTDEAQTSPFLTITTQQIIDFSAAYTVMLPSGEAIGSLRRKGMKSTFLRDEWLVFDERDERIAMIQEDSQGLALLRRFIEIAAVVAPQKFTVTATDGRPIATLRQHFNPFVYRLGVAIHTEDERVDDLLILAAGVLIAAIEGRQS